MDYEALITVMRRLALQAGEKIMEIYDSADFEVKLKADESPVTAADEAADAIISAGLRAAFPEVLLVTEEQAASHSLSGDTFLIVDPLDGTKEFIEGVPQFVVSIGLVRSGVPILGVLYNPVKQELFRTDDSGGVWYNDDPARLCQADSLHQVGCLNSRSETRRGLWEPWKNEFKTLIPIGSVAYKLGLVSSGQEDFFVTLRPKNEWDVCAGHALLKAQGGTLKTNLGKEIVYNQRKTVITPGMTGGNVRLVEAFIQRFIAREGK